MICCSLYQLRYIDQYVCMSIHPSNYVCRYLASALAVTYCIHLHTCLQVVDDVAFVVFIDQSGPEVWRINYAHLLSFVLP